MNENLKEKLNIITRCIIYTFIISITLGLNKHYEYYTDFLFIKGFFDTLIFSFFIMPFTSEESIFGTSLVVAGYYNFIFFSYFYAKICGLYKKLKKYNFWIKSLIFLIISCFAYLINTYDIKTLKPYEIDFKIEIWIYVASIFSAFLLNIFFNFLTKKFPKPFEKIGYVCSIEFFKDIVGKFKKAN